MKKIILLSLFLIVSGLMGRAQNIVPANWKFHTGDKPEWALPAFDDSRWQNIDPLRSWEKQDDPGYDGFAWYRTKVFFPERLKAKAEEMGGLILYLGRIDDADMTWFNGELIGQTGVFPPDYLTAWSQPRRYHIDASQIRWDTENLIAVRVYDAGGDGGLYGGPVELRLAALDEKLNLKAVFETKDQILTPATAKQIQLEFSSGLKQTINGSLKATVVSDFGHTVADTVFRIMMGQQQSRRFTLLLSRLAPGFYRLNLAFQNDDYARYESTAFGIEPEKIASPVDAQPDFDDYWKRAKAELSALDPQFKTIRLDSLCSPQREVFLVEMRSLGGILVRGWYSVPTKKGIFPAILRVQGYSTYAQPEDADYGNDLIGFALNIRGHGNSRDELNPGFPGFLLDGVDNKETYIYRGAYMDCLRAVDFLFSRPEVDKKRVAVEGASQGGALAIATAALDNQRIAVAVPQIPFLADFRDYFNIAPWPANEFEAYIENQKDASWEKVFNTLSYVDIKNLASRVKAPVLMSVGLDDEVCPPHINFGAYNQLKSPKTFVVYPGLGHEVPKEFNRLKMEFIRAKLRQIK